MVKNLPTNAGDAGSIPRWGRDPLEKGNGNPLHHSCLGNPMDRGAWRAPVHGVAKELDTTQPLNNNTPGKLFSPRLGFCNFKIKTMLPTSYLYTVTQKRSKRY